MGSGWPASCFYVVADALLREKAKSSEKLHGYQLVIGNAIITVVICSGGNNAAGPQC
jgi:hypothetical protein